MSNLYNLEPQPTAKVILHTTLGDLLLELFAKQTPLASRNFLQHCLDGYYDNTIFHRLVPRFIVQGGDPTGTGSGGLSAINNGQPFDDEFHSRLKFNRRGLLGSANEGKNSNGSQFFLTLGATPELQGKNTMFGRIEGDTIYNLMKIGDAELSEGEGSERPLYLTKITGTEVLVNPFEDLVARVRVASPVRGSDNKREVKKRKKNAGKGALSFEDGEEQDEPAPIIKKAKFNAALVSAGDDQAEQPKKPQAANRSKKKAVSESSEVAKPRQPLVVPEFKPRRSSHSSSSESEAEENDESATKSARMRDLDRTNAEIAALKASMKRDTNTQPQEKSKPKSALESMIPSTSTRGRRRGKAADEAGALDIFKAFKARLEDMPTAELTSENAEPAAIEHAADTAPTQDAEDEAELCDLHFIANCQSCKAWDKDEGADDDLETDETDGAWMTHQLTFAKDTLGKDLEWKKKMQEIEVIDPREKARSIRDERKRDKAGRLPR